MILDLLFDTLFPICNLRDLKSDIANVQYSSKNTRKPFCKNPWRVWNEAYPVTQILLTSADLALRHIHSFYIPHEHNEAPDQRENWVPYLEMALTLSVPTTHTRALSGR